MQAQAEAGERQPAAFVHMRWEKDDTEGWPVLYCYDIQLEPSVQRKGLGRCDPHAALPYLRTEMVYNVKTWRATRRRTVLRQASNSEQSQHQAKEERFKEMTAMPCVIRAGTS